MADDQPDRPLLAQRGFVPVPDPTTMTTKQLEREIWSLREIVEAKIEGLGHLLTEQVHCLGEANKEKFSSIETQFRERDVRDSRTLEDNKTAIGAALQAAKEAAAAIDEKTAHLEALHGEKFRSISIQFTERDVRAEQTSRDSKVAVDAALQAAKEAVGEQNRSSALAIAKSEAATVKQIDQLQILLQTATGAIDGKITDIKDRLTIIEGKTIGATAARDVSQGNQIQWVGIMGLVLGAVVGLGGILMAVTSGNVPTPAVERVIVAPSSGSNGQLR